MKALVVSTVLALAANASAEPSFEVLDRGTAIEVIAHDVKAAHTTVNPMRSRLEVDVVGSPRSVPLVPTTGAIKVVEFDGQPSRVLSVKLPLERPAVKQMAKFAQAIQVGDDLHLLFPRELPAEGAKVVLPEPTVPAALDAKAKALAPVIKPFGPEKPAKPTAENAVAAGTIATPVTEAKSEPAPNKEDKPEKFTADEQPSGNASMYAMMGLGAIGLGAWMLKRKKASATPASNIEMIAQRSLGAKAKVVWLAAGGREMVVAVTPQNVRMLGQWKKHDKETASSVFGNAALPEATALEPRRERAATNSPVAGILKLRERQPTFVPTKVEVEILDEEIATGDLDADAIWAKEILAASGGRR